MSDVKVVNSEAEFRLEELFFSTTDTKGIIRNGNSVFARVSGYRYEDLVDRPHNVIRHPDMPRTIFKLLWQYLENRKPIVAYVKNRAIDGSYYWVVALVTPLPEGFLSVRFKPSTDTFPVVRQVYQELRDLELNMGDFGSARQEAMNAGLVRLNAILKERGFRDYDDFMASVIRTELLGRDKQLNEHGVASFPARILAGDDFLSRQFGAIFSEGVSIYNILLRLFSQIDEFIRPSGTLSAKSEFLRDLTESFQLVSMNAAVEAARARSRSSSLAVIAGHLGGTSRDISRLVIEMQNRIEALAPPLARVGLALTSARLQIEMMLVFCNEFVELRKEGAGVGDQLYFEHAPAMIESLVTAFQSTFAEMSTAFEEVEKPMLLLNESGEDLRRTIITLLFSQTIGTVEAVALGSEGNFHVIFNEIRGLIDSAKLQLGDLSSSISDIHERLKALPLMTRECADSLENIGMYAERIAVSLNRQELASA